ncbi:hypothetical protein MIND_00148700 [Mycena indigotica]|uniref:Uncharacterized protein n=1 Tax=Mycena indigotica TaxID=2126181 RepID=A0A8H6TIE6_9AGAR|nr:uncharacterized protein MIND_00148700 [Mycena indigotica]KAF7316300.1 hypothetical protein MIND_00148700 [Mycena indigotica]
MLRLAWILVLFVFGAQTALVNITIDDTDPNAWTWIGKWDAYTKDKTTCDGCFAHPDPSQVHNSSWHDGRLCSGSFTSQGVAVYIYGIDLSGFEGDPANISFSVKNSPVSTFHYLKTPSGYIYNSLFFSAHGLDDSAPFTVDWTENLSSAGGGVGLFDYAVVTVEQKDALPVVKPSTTTTTSSATTSSSITPTSTSEKSSISPSSTSARKSIPAADSTSSSALQSSISAFGFSLPTGSSLPTTHQSKTGFIVGGVVGGIAVFLFLAGVCLCYWRRRSRSAVPTQEVVPFQPQPPSPLTITTQQKHLESNPLMSTHSFTSSPISNTPSGTLQNREAEFEQRLRDLEAMTMNPPAYS